MLQGDRIATVSETCSKADVVAASLAFRVAPWAIAVEMDEWPEVSHGLLLPETVGERLRPTTGVVIGSGSELLPLGSRVVVERAAGYWFAGFEFGGYEATGQVRIYGTATGASLAPRHYEALDAIMAIIEETGIRAIGRWVLIRREKPNQTSEFGLELPDSQKYRSGKATVISGTGKVPGLGIEPGAKVLYNVQAVHTTLCGLESRFPDLSGDPEDYALIDAREILMVTT